MSAYIFLVALSLTTHFSMSNLLLINFRHQGSEEPLDKFPENDDDNQYELYFSFSKYTVESQSVEEELEIKTKGFNYDDSQNISVNLEVYQILVDHETDHFDFYKKQKGIIAFNNMDMAQLTEEINQSLVAWQVQNDYVFDFAFKKVNKNTFKAVIMTFAFKTICDMAKKTSITEYQFKEERLILL